MSALGGDRVVRGLLALAFVSAATLTIFALWRGAGEAPEHWARARWTLLPLTACLGAAAACAFAAWRRRADAARWMPLAGGALTCTAAMIAVLSGAL